MPNNFIHPDKARWIKDGDKVINALLPKTGEKYTYLQLTANDSYNTLIGNLKKYLGVYSSDQDVPELMQDMLRGVQEAMSIEAKYKVQLEELALTTVLNIDEFHMVQEAYINGDVKFKISLEQPKAADYKLDAKPPEPIEMSEEDIETAKLFEDMDDTATRRRLANLLITGGAFSKMYLFHLVESRLNAISPKLLNIYGTIGATAEMGYWTFADGVEENAAKCPCLAAGVEEVVPEDGTYTITAKAITFPYLIHEIVKGIYEWLSIDPEMKQLLGKEKIEHETRDVLVGPALFKKVMGFIPADKQQYIPSIQKKLITLPTKDAQEVLLQTPRGKSLINQLIAEAVSEWDQYLQDKAKYTNQ